MKAKASPKISDFIPDPQNANKGTERGRSMLERSLRELGAGRSILVDKNNVTIAGNKTLEVAAELKLRVKEIETDGNELIVVRRTDLDLLKDQRAKELAIADNRVGEVSLEWDPAVLAVQGIDLAPWFSEAELGRFAVEESLPPDLPNGDRAPFQQMTFTVHDEQAEEIKAALDKAKTEGGAVSLVNENSNGNALAWICGAFNRG